MSRQASDDRDLDRFLREAEAESARLQEQIAAARASARPGAAPRPPADAPVDPSALFQAAQRELAQIERETHEIVGRIAAAAEAEETRLLVGARQQVAAMRAAASATGPRTEGRTSDGDRSDAW